MKRLTQSLIVVLFLLTVVPVQLFASTVITSDPIEAKAAADKEAARVLIERLEVIKKMDKSALSSSEKKDLRKEVRLTRSELRKNNNGIYLSIGAIIIIILLLILLL